MKRHAGTYQGIVAEMNLPANIHQFRKWGIDLPSAQNVTTKMIVSDQVFSCLLIQHKDLHFIASAVTSLQIVGIVKYKIHIRG